MDDEDDLDKDNNNNKTTEGMTMRNMLTAILQKTMRASDMSNIK